MPNPVDQNLVAAKELHQYLASLGKEKSWLHLLRSRIKPTIFPEPIIKVPVNLIQKSGGFKKRKGREIFYPSGSKEHAKNVIRLHDQDGLSYNEIANMEEIQAEVARLNLLAETGLFNDKRVKQPGFFENYESALIVLKDVFKWDKNSYHYLFLSRIPDEAIKLFEEYKELNKILQKHTEKKKGGNEEIVLQKAVIGQKLDYLYSIMKMLTDYFIKLESTKIIFGDGWKEWRFNMEKIK